MKKATYPVSVVIATLGGDSLPRTLQVLNQGPNIPAQILICIPEAESRRLTNVAGGNISILPMPCRGQVAQRAYGFGHATQPMVLQLDDDILIDPQHVHGMIESLQGLGHGNVVAPIYRDLGTQRCLHTYRRGWVGWLQNVYAFLVCGARWGLKRMGTIAPSGVSYGVDELLCAEAPVQTEWLPGGCVLSFREDTVHEDFFPFPGKAYCEDLLHSWFRRNRGLRLWVLPRYYCMTPAASPVQFAWTSMKADLKVRHYVVRKVGGSRSRLALWFAIEAMRRAMASITNVMFSQQKKR